MNRILLVISLIYASHISDTGFKLNDFHLMKKKKKIHVIFLFHICFKSIFGFITHSFVTLLYLCILYILTWCLRSGYYKKNALSCDVKMILEYFKTLVLQNSRFRRISVTWSSGKGVVSVTRRLLVLTGAMDQPTYTFLCCVT